jgi:hypothetical protein
LKYKVLLKNDMEKEIRKIRSYLLLFSIALFLSGATAIPAETELVFLLSLFPQSSTLSHFLVTIKEGVLQTSVQYPFIFYGYDWLAFAHFMLAVLFIGPIRDPLGNKWVIEFGMISCALVIPFAMIAGYFRGIPFWWRLVDCSFGIVGIIPLYACYKKIIRVEHTLHKISQL